MTEKSDKIGFEVNSFLIEGLSYRLLAWADDVKKREGMVNEKKFSII